MKRVTLISVLAGIPLLAACGESDQNVSRNHLAPLDLVPANTAMPDHYSSRSSLDLLSFS